MKATVKKRLWLLFSSVLTLPLAVGAIALVDLMNPYNDALFDTRAWLASEDNRMAMSEDLVENKLTSGMSEGKVELLIGPAEQVLTRSEDGGGNRLQGHHTWTYYIGNDSFGKGDDVFVYIHFDASGLVVGSGIYGY